MKESKYLAGAFDAYGIISVIGRNKPRISLLTTSDHKEYVDRFVAYTGFGMTKPFQGRWHWSCDDPAQIQEFWQAVGPHLIQAKRDVMVGIWEEWRRQVMEKSDGSLDPGAIDGELYAGLGE